MKAGQTNNDTLLSDKALEMSKAQKVLTECKNREVGEFVHVQTNANTWLKVPIEKFLANRARYEKLQADKFGKINVNLL